MAEQQMPRSPMEPPDWLRAQSRQMQAQAPYCGLGFKHGILDTRLHNAMQEQLRRVAGDFVNEAHIEEIGTTESDFFPALHHEDKAFNASVSAQLQPLHEEWSGLSLTESACYGFRAYQRGSYLHNHVDRGQTHIISSTICVDAQLDEPWPLFVEDIFGEAHEIDLQPGEYLLYEGARLLHGRPWPLKGDYYVGLFVHYRPLNLEP